MSNLKLKLHTGRCSAHTKAGTRCKRHCIIGYEYYYAHLEKKKNQKLKIQQFHKLKRAYLHLIIRSPIIKSSLEKTKPLLIIMVNLLMKSLANRDMDNIMLHML